MARRRLVPVTRSTGLGPLPQMVVETAGEHALHRAFNKHGLGPAAAEQDDLYLPHTAMVGIFEHAAKHIGARDFGLNVGRRMPYPSYGLWTKYVVTGATLIDALNRLCDSVRFQHTGAIVRLEREGTHVVLRHYPHSLAYPNTQHSDHLLYPLLYFLQLYLGSQWWPAWFELCYPRDANANEIERHFPSPIRFGTGRVGVAMPASCLTARRIISQESVSLTDLEIEDPIQHFQEPLRSIIALATLRLMEGKTDLDGTAQLAGVSTRTLQRSLNDEGISYRGLLDRVCERRAKQLLTQSNLTITQIALALGYSEHANFTRAFTRWTGQSPLQYRLRIRAR